MNILTQRNWLIFILLVLPMLGVQLLTLVVLHFFNINLFDKLARLVMFFVVAPFFFSYPILVMKRLDDQLKTQTKYQGVTRFKLIIAIILFFILYLLRSFTNVNPFLASVLGIVCLLSGLLIFSIPAKQLKSIELRRNAGLWEYVPEIFQFLYWPLGLWWIQPRLNKIVTRSIVINE